MGDNLAQQLFDAFWKRVEEFGRPRGVAWHELHQTQRDTWEAAATFARKEMRQRIAGELREYSKNVYPDGERAHAFEEAAQVIDRTLYQGRSAVH